MSRRRRRSARAASARRSWPVEARPARRRARSAAAARARASTCRSPTRRRCPASRRGAGPQARRRRRRACTRPPPLTGKCLVRPSTASSGSRHASAIAGARMTQRSPCGAAARCQQASRGHPLPSGGDLGGAALLRPRAAAGEGQPGGRSPGRRHGARDGRAACRRARAEPRHRGQQARACRGGAGWRNSAAHRRPLDDAARRTSRPPRRTYSATTPRSWVISRIAMPSSSRSRCSSSRICAWMVTSSAVVGSSAISSCGPAGERHRDHDPLAHAARELVRVLLERGARAPPMPTSRSSSSTAVARLGAAAGRGAAAAPRRSGSRP